MGKSTTAACLVDFGIPVIDTDQLARDLVRPGQPALEEVVQAFGPEVLNADGTLHRSRLAERVFADVSARARLEGILHPRIRSEWRNQVSRWRAEESAVTAVVIPLLFETDAGADFDEILCVACSAATQRQRLKDRGWTDDHLNQRLAAQWPVAEKIRRSSIVIWTDTLLPIHRRQVGRMLRGFGLNFDPPQESYS